MKQKTDMKILFISYFFLTAGHLISAYDLFGDALMERHQIVKKAVEPTLNHLETNARPSSPVLSRQRRAAFNSSALSSLNGTRFVSEQCLLDFRAFLDGIEGDAPGYSTKPKWAKLMYDSYGGPQAGILQNNLFWMGDFWQCLSIDVWRSDNASERDPQPDFRGKYCLTSVVFIPLGPKFSFKVGTCLPSSCKAEEFQIIAQELSPSIFFLVFVQDNFCQTREYTPMDATGKAIGWLFGFLIAVVICATIYEVYLIAKRTLRPNAADHLTARLDDFSLQKVGCISGFWKSFLLAFSAHRNTRAILNVTPSGPQTLSIIHGVRAISMSWVVMCHVFLVLHQQFPWKNQVQAATQMMRDIFFQAILTGEFSVDSFFCMSGFLITYLLLNELKKKKGKFNILLFYFHRIWRLSPAYMLVIAYMAALYPYAGKGPIWPATFGDRDVCRRKWWKNLLYINVYFPQDDKCLPQVWYLCLDVAYYFVSPFILYPLFKKPRLGKFIFILFFITSFITPALLIHTRNLASFPTNNIEAWQRERFMVEVYDKPWCRMSAYLIGMIYGYILYVKGPNMKIKPVVVIVGWLTALAIGLTLVYGTLPYIRGDYGMSHAMFIVYGTLTRPAWSLMLGWVILTCCTGHGGVVTSILSWRGFLPFSKLSYTAYLVHFTVLAEFYATRPDSTYIDYYTMTFYTLFMFSATILVAWVFTLIGEAPFIAMEKLLLDFSPSRKDTEKQAAQELPANLKVRPSPPPFLKTNAKARSDSSGSETHLTSRDSGEQEDVYERTINGCQTFKRNKNNISHT